MVDVKPGHRADDPLYVPSYRRAEKVLDRNGVLVVGDSKMSALTTRGTIVAGQDYYLTPLADQKDEPDLLPTYSRSWHGREAEAARIFLPEDLPGAGSQPDTDKAIAYGFTVSRQRSAQVSGEEVTSKPLSVVRSLSYLKTMQAGLKERLAKAEAALCDLTPPRQRGKRQIDEASLLSSIGRIEQQYRVQGLFHLDYRLQRCKSDRCVVMATNQSASSARCAFNCASAATERGQSRRPSSRLAGASMPPMRPRSAFPSTRLSWPTATSTSRRTSSAVCRASFSPSRRSTCSETMPYQGLFHFLTLGTRLLALGDYLARQTLAAQRSTLTGIYAGNSKRGTAKPTTERMLAAFEGIDLFVMPAETDPKCFLSRLSDVQERILALLGLPVTLFTDLQTKLTWE